MYKFGAGQSAEGWGPFLGEATTTLDDDDRQDRDPVQEHESCMRVRRLESSIVQS